MYWIARTRSTLNPIDKDSKAAYCRSLHKLCIDSVVAKELAILLLSMIRWSHEIDYIIRMPNLLVASLHDHLCICSVITSHI